jgi:hypothetical protein
VFVRQGNIWRSDGTAAEPQQLTDLGLFSYADQPAVSPADGRIAFVKVTSPSRATVEANPEGVSKPSYALTVMDADGGNQNVIWEYTDGQMAFPAWSADGTALFVTTSELLTTSDAQGRSQRIQGLRVPVSGGMPQVVAEDAIGVSMAPDGSAIAYARLPRTGTAFSLVVAAPDGSAPQEMLGSSRFQSIYGLRFSPDGERLVFAATGGPPIDSQGIPVGVRQLSPLERALSLLEPPTANAHGEPYGVWTVNRDGTGLRLVFILYHGIPTATFSPDGTQLAVMDTSGIYVLRADGSQVQQVSFEGDSGGLVWVE